MKEENIYFVDDKDTPTGKTSEKYVAHNENTQLHAAFSCYVFDENGKFLVTKRAKTKKVWPGVWTNSCCGHPFPGETRQDALKRRVEYELGMKVKDISLVLPTYMYKTPPYRGIIEHEYCPVFVAIADSKVIPNPAEVDDFAWVEWNWYVSQLQNDSSDYSDPDAKDAPNWSWWCKDQLIKLQKEDVFISFIGSFQR